MRFDNAEFERKSKRTMATLEKLKSALNFDNTSKSMNELQDSVDDMDFSPLEKGLDDVGKKFNWLDQIAIGALRRIGDQLVNTTERMAKGLSVDQISSGWGKYAAKAQSVQTIVNATGKSVEEVGEYLQYLMTFSDETSFSFTAMTQSLSTMLSTGGDIDKLTPLITGIANATAYAGKSNSEFQRSIFNLAQSYGQGYLSLIDWKSVMGAGVNSEALINKFIEVGEALGKIKAGSVSLGNFTDTLKDKWVDREVMEKAFGEFSQFSDAIIDMMDRDVIDNASEGIELFADQFDELSVKAFVAGQEAKSFSEAVDAVKDAVSSGWMETFEIIFGNYEESKTLWSTLYDGFWDIFASGASKRNRLLKEAFGLNAVSELGLTLEDLEQSTGKLHRKLLQLGVPLEDFYEATNTLTGRELLTDSIANVFEAINKLIETVKTAWAEVVKPFTSGDLYSVLRSLNEFTKSLIMSEETADKLKGALKGVFTVVDAGRSVLSFAFSIVGKLFSLVKNIIGALATVSDVIGTTVSDLYLAVRESGLLEIVFGALHTSVSRIIDILNGLVRGFSYAVRNVQKTEAFKGLVNVFTGIGNAVYYTVGAFAALADAVSGMIYTVFSKNNKTVTRSSMSFGFLGESFNGFLASFNEFLDKVGSTSGVQKLISSITALKDSIVTAVLGIAASIPALGNWLSSFIGDSSQIKSFGDVIVAVISMVAGAAGSLIDIFNKVAKGSVGFVGGIVMAIGGIGDSFKSLIETIVGKFQKEDKTNPVKSTIDNVKDALAKAKTDLENFSILDAIAAGFDAVTKSMGGLSREIYNVFSPALLELKELFGGDEAALNVIGLLELWVIMTQLTKLVGAIKKIDSEGIQEKIKSLIGSITGVFNELKASFKWSTKLKALAKFIVSFAIGIALVSASIAGLMFAFSYDEDAATIAVVSVLGIIAVLGNIIDEVGALNTKEIDPKPILSLAAFFAILGGTVALLANTENVWQGMGVLTAMTAAVLGLSFIFASLDNALKKNFSLNGDAFDGLSGLAKNLLELAVALIALAIPVKLLGMMKDDELNKGISALKSVATIVGLFTVLTSWFTKKEVSISGDGFLGIAAGMLLIAAAMKVLSDIPILRDDGSGMIAAGGALVIVGVAIGALANVLNFSAGPITKFGGALIVFAVGIAAVVGAMKKANSENGGKSLSETFASIGDSLMKLLGIVIIAIGVAGGVGGIIMLIPGAMGVIASIGTGLMAVGKKIIGFVKTLGDSIKNIGIGAVLIIASAMLISTAGSQIALGIQMMVETICKVIINTAPLIAEAVLTLIDSILASVANHADSILKSILDIFVAIVNAAWNMLVKHIGITIGTGIGGILGFLFGGGPLGAAVGAGIGGTLGAGFEKAIEKYGGFGMETMSSEIDTVTDSQNKLTDAIQKGTEASKVARGTIEETTSAYADQNEQVASLVQNVFGGNVNPDLLKNAGSQMINKLGWDYMPEATSFMESYGDTLKEAAESIMPDVGSDSVAGLVNGVTENLDLVNIAGADLGGTLLDSTRGVLGIQSPSKEMAKLGAYAVEGLKMGLTKSSMVGDTYEAAGRLGSIILEALRDRLKIHSPSEETMDVGDYSVQGLAKGLTDNSFKAELAAGNVADATKAAIDRYDEFYLAGLENAGAYARGFASALQSGDVVTAINAAGKKYERQIDISDANDAIAQHYTDKLPGYITSEHIQALYQNYLAQREAAKKVVEDAAGTETPSGYSGSSGSSKTLAESIRERYEKQLSELSRNQEIKDLQYELWQLAYGEDANNKEWQEKHSENLASKIETQTKRVELAQKEYDEILKSYNKTSKEAVEANSRLLNEQIELQTLRNSLDDDFEKDVSNIVDKFEKELDRIDSESRITEAEEANWVALYGDSEKASTIAARKSAEYTKKLAKQQERVTKVYEEYSAIAKEFGESSIKAQKYYASYLEEQTKLYELQKQSEELASEVSSLVYNRYQKAYDQIDQRSQNREAYLNLQASLIGDETNLIEKQQKAYDKASETYNEAVERYGKYSAEASTARQKLNEERDKLKRLKKEDEESKKKQEELGDKMTVSQLTEAYRSLYDESQKAMLAREYYNQMVEAHGESSEQAIKAYREFAQYQTELINQMQVVMDNYDMDPVAKTIVNNLATLIVENHEGLFKAANAIGDAIVKNANLPEKMKTSISAVGKILGSDSTINILSDALTMAGHMAAGDVAKAVNDGFSIFKTLISTDVGKQISSSILSSIVESFETGKSVEIVSTAFSNLFGALSKGSVAKSATSIVSMFSSLASKGGILSTLFGTISSFIGTIGSSLGGVLSTVFTFVTTLAGPEVLAIVGAIAAVCAVIGTALVGIFNPDLFRKVASGVWNFIKTIVEGLYNGVKSVVTGAFNLGKNIISGLINGIKSFASGAVNAVKNVGSWIVNSFKSFFGIHSPSKVFAVLGGFLMKGLGNGIEDEASDVVATVGLASKNIVNTVQKAVNAANSISDDTNLTSPVIRPIMDASAIDEGRITLAEMMSGDVPIRFATDTSMNFSENASMAIAEMLEVQNERILGELRLLRDDLVTMSEEFAAGVTAITNMQIVLNDGTLIGGIGNGMNEYLGNQTALDGRYV